MDFDFIYNKYYPAENRQKEILRLHSVSVMQKACNIAKAHPEMGADYEFIRDAAMLHDIGIFLCNAPHIECFGHEPYIRHGILGAELMRQEGFPRIAHVCERHTGTGLPAKEIMAQNLPLPHRDFCPISIEEKIICYADKFFSKSKLYEEKTIAQARASLLKFGAESVARFDQWSKMFA